MACFVIFCAVKGIYVHIPFCRKKCIYCDFVVFDTNNKFLGKTFDEYTDLVCAEIDFRFREIKERSDFKTLYIGGGTPSFVGVGNLLKILNRVFLYVPFDSFEEITIEANPEDVSLDFAKEIKEIGINRISLGVQSMSEEALRKLSRRNTPKVNYEALENLAKVGFSNVNIDLIFDIPGVPVDEIVRTLEAILGYDVVKHVSAYGLMVEDFTPFKLFVDRGLIRHDSCFEEQFLVIHEYLSSKGFRHYEISNYAFPGYESKHNLLYWRRQEYLGIGVSACGFYRDVDGVEKRYQNVFSIKTYREMLSKGSAPLRYEEILGAYEIFEELVMLGLRISEGIDLKNLYGLVDIKKYEEFLDKAKRLASWGFLEFRDGRLLSTLKGWLVHDWVVLDLTS